MTGHKGKKTWDLLKGLTSLSSAGTGTGEGGAGGTPFFVRYGPSEYSGGSEGGASNSEDPMTMVREARKCYFPQ